MRRYRRPRADVGAADFDALEDAVLWNSSGGMSCIQEGRWLGGGGVSSGCGLNGAEAGRPGP